MKKILSAILVAALSLVVLSSCNASPGGSDSTKESTYNPNTEDMVENPVAGEHNAANEAYPLSVTDSNGSNFEITSYPERIVVLDFAVLDLLEVIGYTGEVMTASANLPTYLEDSFSDSPNSGSLKELDMEAINEFGPDLIFISGRQLDYIDDLNEIASTLFFTADSADFLNSSFNNLREMAKVFGHSDKVVEELDALEGKISDLQAISTAINALSLVILTNDGAISAYGSGSRFGFLFDDLGLASVDDTIDASTHGQTISYEYISDKNPDIIFYVDRTAIAGGSTEASAVLDNELIQATKAGQNENLFSLNPEFIYTSAGGIQSLNGTLDEIEAALSSITDR